MLMLRNITDGICPRAFLADKKVSNCQKLITCFKAFDSIGNSFLVYLSLIEVRSYKFSKVLANSSLPAIGEESTAENMPQMLVRS